jgi:hypothetical protein
MVDDALVCNESITVFDEIIHSPDVTWRAIEIAGHGIAASARCTLSTLDDKTRPYPAEPLDAAIQRASAYADYLMELGAIEDELAALWHQRRTGHLDDVSFEGTLRDLVQRMEAWPRSASGG